MGTGAASGEERATEAARAAISSPLLEDLSIDGAHGVLINITGGPDLTLFEVNEASTLIQEAAHEDANIIFGAVIDENMREGEMRVTVIATGLDDQRVRRRRTDDVAAEDAWNVTRLHPGPAPAMTSSEPLPAAQDLVEPTQAQLPDPMDTPLLGLDGGATRAEDFISPFEDELDVPTFLRRSAD
jgi:cell division protein FtsZ